MLSTWRTVTGKRTPWSFHIAVIPRFRAMTPVRIEPGDHFEVLDTALAVDVAVTAFAATEECIFLNCRRGAGWCPPIVQSRSISALCAYW